MYEKVATKLHKATLSFKDTTKSGNSSNKTTVMCRSRSIKNSNDILVHEL